MMDLIDSFYAGTVLSRIPAPNGLQEVVEHTHNI